MQKVASSQPTTLRTLVLFYPFPHSPHTNFSTCARPVSSLESQFNPRKHKSKPQYDTTSHSLRCDVFPFLFLSFSFLFKQKISVDVDVQKSVTLYIVVMETRNDPWWQLTMKLPCAPATPLLDIYSGELKEECQMSVLQYAQPYHRSQKVEITYGHWSSMDKDMFHIHVRRALVTLGHMLQCGWTFRTL